MRYFAWNFPSMIDDEMIPKKIYMLDKRFNLSREIIVKNI
jgi:hypothetical protein